MRWNIAIGVAAAVSAGLPFSAQAQTTTPSYFIYPVTTELQRQVIPHRADVVVIMDTTAAINDGKISLDGLNLDRLRKDLLEYKKGNARMHFNLFFKGVEERERRAQDLLRYAFIGAAHDQGFSKVTAFGTWSNDDIGWPEFVDTLTNKKPRQPKGDEGAKGDDVVKVFPVRSELSRFLTRDADCVVFVIDSLAKENGKIPDRIRDATAKYVAELKLTHKKGISFSIQLFEGDIKGPLVTECGQFAMDLGFERCTVTFR